MSFFPKKGGRPQGVSVRKVSNLSTAFSFTVIIKSWRKPAHSKGNSNLCSVSWKNGCRHPALEEISGWGMLCSPSVSLWSKPRQDRPKRCLLLGPYCPPALPFPVCCSPSSKPLSNRSIFWIIFPRSSWMVMGELKYMLGLPFFFFFFRFVLIGSKLKTTKARDKLCSIVKLAYTLIWVRLFNVLNYENICACHKAHTEQYLWILQSLLIHTRLITVLWFCAAGSWHDILTCIESASSILIGLRLLVASFTVLIYCFSISQLKPLPDGNTALEYWRGERKYLYDANVCSFIKYSWIGF